MPVTTTRADRSGSSCTAIMMSRSFPKSALVPVTNKTSRRDKVTPPDLHVPGQVTGGGPAEHRVVVGGLDLAGARPLHPRVRGGERGTGRNGLGGDHAGVREVDGRLLVGQDLLAAA